MREKRKLPHRGQAAGRRRAASAGILAAAILALSLAAGGQVAFAADQDVDAGKAGQTCSLAVKAGRSELEEDLALAEVQVDIYRVADAAKADGYDTYDWTMTRPFSSLTITEGIDNAGWKALAQEAAAIVLGAGSAVAGEGRDSALAEGIRWDPAASVAKIQASDGALMTTLAASSDGVTSQASGLPAGLYLVLAHGTGIREYAGATASALSSDKDSEGGEADGQDTSASSSASGAAGIYTVAQSPTNAYRFAPELVALPTKAVDPETGLANTANAGDWLYNVGVTLKPSQEALLGQLRITKKLDDYELRKKTTDGETREIRDASTFVFEVSAYESEAAYEAQGASAARLYHNFASITFTGAGRKSATLTKLPADAYVVVQEVYSGKTYTQDQDQSATIEAGGTVEVTFENRYDNMHGGAGSVTNHFTYKGDSAQWGWEQVEDSAEGATVLQSE